MVCQNRAAGKLNVDRLLQNDTLLTRRSRNQKGCDHAASFQHSGISFQLRNKKRRVHSPSSKYCVHFGINFTSKGLLTKAAVASGAVGIRPVQPYLLQFLLMTIVGNRHQPHNEWMKQVARNLTDVVDGFLRYAGYLNHDREPLFSDPFQETLGAVGVKTVKLPAKSPNMNASIRSFC